MSGALARFFDDLRPGVTSTATRARHAARWSAPAVDALVSMGWLVPAGLVVEVPCDEAGGPCARVVQPGDDGDGWLGVCRESGACAAKTLADEDVRTWRLAPAALATTLAKAFGVTERTAFSWHGARLPLGTTANGERCELVLDAAEIDTTTTGVLWLVAGPRAPGPARAPAVVHLATAVGLSSSGLVVAVRGGPDPAPGPVVVPRPRQWAELRLVAIDGHTVRATVGTVSVRLSFHDLALENLKSKAPSRAFELLIAICNGAGEVKYRDFGGMVAAKRQVSFLRAALKERFGADGDPLPTLGPGKGWRAAFVARALG